LRQLLPGNFAQMTLRHAACPAALAPLGLRPFENLTDLLPKQLAGLVDAL
jgi:hypothetical protein